MSNRVNLLEDRFTLFCCWPGMPKSVVARLRPASTCALTSRSGSNLKHNGFTSTNMRGTVIIIGSESLLALLAAHWPAETLQSDGAPCLDKAVLAEKQDTPCAHLRGQWHCVGACWYQLVPASSITAAIQMSGLRLCWPLALGGRLCIHRVVAGTQNANLDPPCHPHRKYKT